MLLYEKTCRRVTPTTPAPPLDRIGPHLVMVRLRIAHPHLGEEWGALPRRCLLVVRLHQSGVAGAQSARHIKLWRSTAADLGRKPCSTSDIANFFDV